MRKISWGQYHKSLLDRLIESIRFGVVSKHIKGPSVLDLGCGYDAKLLRQIEDKINTGVGVDVSINKKCESDKIRLIGSSADGKINLPPASFDTIIALAVIEHVNDPQTMLSQAFKLLKHRGTVLLTTPAKGGKPLLELLARMRLISKHEIADHKRYYDGKMLRDQLTQAGFNKEKIELKYFEFGLNIFAKATK